MARGLDSIKLDRKISIWVGFFFFFQTSKSKHDSKGSR